MLIDIICSSSSAQAPCGSQFDDGEIYQGIIYERGGTPYALSRAPTIRLINLITSSQTLRRDVPEYVCIRSMFREYRFPSRKKTNLDEHCQSLSAPNARIFE